MKKINIILILLSLLLIFASCDKTDETTSKTSTSNTSTTNGGTTSDEADIASENASIINDESSEADSTDSDYLPIESGKVYGEYIDVDALPQELKDALYNLYTSGIIFELRVQYIDTVTKENRWVNFFKEFDENSEAVYDDTTMKDSEYIGMFSVFMATKDDRETVEAYYEGMNPDASGPSSFSSSATDFEFNRQGGTGGYFTTVSTNPAVESNTVVEPYGDLLADGYLTFVSANCEWLAD